MSGRSFFIHPAIVLALNLIGFTPLARAGCYVDYLKSVTGPQNDTQLISPSKLPAVIEIYATKKEANKALEVALRAWDENVNIDKLNKIVDELADGNTAILKTKRADKLKDYRQFSGRMRDMYSLFSEAHAAPEEFNRFVIDFGKLNDAISAKKTKIIVKMAKRLDADLEKLPELETLSFFRPDDREGFKSYIEGSVEDLRNSAAKSEIEVPDFHHSRKSIRKLISYFKITGVLRPSPDNEVVLEYLGGLSRKMGDIQDKLVEKAMKGKIDYNSSKIPFDEKFRKLILEFTNRVKFD